MKQRSRRRKWKLDKADDANGTEVGYFYWGSRLVNNFVYVAIN